MIFSDWCCGCGKKLRDHNKSEMLKCAARARYRAEKWKAQAANAEKMAEWLEDEAKEI